MTFGRNSMTSPMREHWERTERWFDRFCDLVEMRANGERIDEEDVEDCALVVLQNCHAAEDWLQNQTKENALKKGMRKVFARPHMELCKSVVTASKHFTLTKAGQRRDGAIHPHENIRFFAWPHVPNRPGRVVMTPVLVLMVEATYYQLDNFILKCVESVRDFLIGNGLSLHTSTLERIAKRKKKLPFPEFRDERGHERVGSQRVRIVSRWPD